MIQGAFCWLLHLRPQGQHLKGTRYLVNRACSQAFECCTGGWNISCKWSLERDWPASLITAASFILIRAQIHTTHLGWSDGLAGQTEASYRNSKPLEFNHPQSWWMTIFKNGQATWCYYFLDMLDKIHEWEREASQLWCHLCLLLNLTLYLQCEWHCERKRPSAKSLWLDRYWKKKQMALH